MKLTYCAGPDKLTYTEESSGTVVATVDYETLKIDFTAEFPESHESIRKHARQLTERPGMFFEVPGTRSLVKLGHPKSEWSRRRRK